MNRNFLYFSICPLFGCVFASTLFPVLFKLRLLVSGWCVTGRSSRQPALDSFFFLVLPASWTGGMESLPFVHVFHGSLCGSPVYAEATYVLGKEPRAVFFGAECGVSSICMSCRIRLCHHQQITHPGALHTDTTPIDY